ncbi:MAG TPA: MlaD family protein [Thermoleophilaceae bacterium]|nr:MlaD family protein [Thermoleophilaceae bacterium]
MRRRRPGSSVLGSSPVLVGAVTVIVTMVAVFLSYNANEGLPFVPTYDLTADVPDANGLVRGNEVRMGGSRVGVVTDIETAPKDNGDVTAHLTLALDERIIPLPKDSTIIVRPRSALGLKYVEVTRGRSERGYPENSTIPRSASKVETQEIDDFFNMFDDPTREGARTNSETVGAGFAGRGEALNRTFAELGPLVEKLEPVMRNIAAPRTGFDRLFPALEQAASQVAPIAETQAAVWVALDTTFASWESVSDSLQDTISEGPPALDTATRELPRQRPFLADSEELFRRFRPAFASLAAAAPGLATAFRAGEPALRRSPALNRRLTRTLATLDRLGDDPRVPSALNRLTRTATLLQPTLAFITPAQSTCNYGTLFFRNVASMTSESDIIGSMLRIAPMSLPITAGSEGGPAATPANGPPGFPAGTTFLKQKLYRDSFLHSNPYPYTAAPGQPQECEAGNEGYSTATGNGENQLAIGNPANPGGVRTEKTERRLP